MAVVSRPNVLYLMADDMRPQLGCYGHATMHTPNLDGLAATTHHDFHDRLASSFPKVDVRRGVRFVEGGERIATAGGLTSGIDMALRVVERYFGREVAARTAFYMEYESKGWKVASSQNLSQKD